jgi:hypothetical protein
MKSPAHHVRTIEDKGHIGPHRMEPEPFALDLRTINFRCCDGHRMSTIAQSYPHGDVWMQIAERAECGQEKMRAQVSSVIRDKTIRMMKIDMPSA